MSAGNKVSKKVSGTMPSGRNPRATCSSRRCWDRIDWFADSTPADNSELLLVSNPSEWIARAGSLTYGAMNLYAVLLYVYDHAMSPRHRLDSHDFMAMPCNRDAVHTCPRPTSSGNRHTDLPDKTTGLEQVAINPLSEQSRVRRPRGGIIACREHSCA